jgi:hypothetical protein
MSKATIEFGWLVDAETGKRLRPATESEESASDRAASASWQNGGDHRGIITADGRPCYVPVTGLDFRDTPRGLD